MCGDFNNHLPTIDYHLSKLNFIPSLKSDIATHKFGNHLDQVYARGITITNAVVNQNLDHKVTDHRCIKVTLKPNPPQQHAITINQLNTNYKPGDHSQLKQGTLRGLVNLESTTKLMMDTDRTIDYPAYEYIGDQELEEAVNKEREQMVNRLMSMRQPVKYRSRA